MKRPTRSGQVLVILCVVVALTAIAHLVFLGWHHLQEYETWKVTSYAVILALVVAISAWLRSALGAAVVGSVSATVLWCVDAATDTSGDGASLWPVGGMFVLAGAAAGAAVVAGTVGAARAAYDRHNT